MPNWLMVGYGSTGRAFCRWALAQQATVTVVDEDASVELTSHPKLSPVLGANIQQYFEQFESKQARPFDTVVVSPGVPWLDVFNRLRNQGWDIVGDVEFCTRQIQATWIGITGTNGKSTVTTLVGRMMEKIFRPVFVGGNLGRPLMEALPQADAVSAYENGYGVLELSSFQLEASFTLKPKVAAILNLSDDHLDRHPTFQAYVAAKQRIFMHQDSSDIAVVPSDAEHPSISLSKLAKVGEARVRTFGKGGDTKLDHGHIIDAEAGLRFDCQRLKVKGYFNQLNACAAASIALSAGCKVGAVEQALEAFEGLPHRLQWIRTLDGVTFIDDSKATNVGAAVASVESCRDGFDKIVLIAGGRDKGGSYGPLIEAMIRSGRAVVLIGEAAPLIRKAIESAVKEGQGEVRHETASDMTDAVHKARRLASTKDCVLLAPACSSFDMFRSYAHRGDAFQEAVRAL